ncbi:MAG: hypothetical protein ABID35_06280 [Candidatus Margulisiibacteriota bacterium]
MPVNLSFAQRLTRVQSLRRPDPGLRIDRSSLTPKGRNMRAIDLANFAAEQLGPRVDHIRDLSVLGNDVPLVQLGEVIEISDLQVVLPTQQALDKLVLDPALRDKLGLSSTTLGVEKTGQQFIRVKWNSEQSAFSAAVALEQNFENMGFGVRLIDMSAAQRLRTLAKDITNAERIEEDVGEGVYDYLEPEELGQLTRLSDFDSKIVYLAQKTRLQNVDLVIRGGNSYDAMRAEQNPGAMIQPTKSGPVEREFIAFEALQVFTR